MISNLKLVSWKRRFEILKETKSQLKIKKIYYKNQTQEKKVEPKNLGKLR